LFPVKYEMDYSVSQLVSYSASSILDQLQFMKICHIPTEAP